MSELDALLGDDAFMSTFHPRLDEKGRLFLPAKWREKLGDTVVLTKGVDHCVTGFSKAGFAAHVSARLRSGPMSSRQVRELRRALIGSADEHSLDRQGRITIPVRLRQYAALAKDCAVVGAGDYFEIWDAAVYEEIERAGDETLNNLEFEGEVSF